jgi:hypothetical protein
LGEGDAGASTSERFGGSNIGGSLVASSTIVCSSSKTMLDEVKEGRMIAG